MLLERAVGNTVRSAGALAVSPATGDYAYPAGCVLVFYSPRRNRQTQFFSSENNRPLTAVAFSGDGRFVCAAEGGRQPAVLVWDTANGKLLAELKGHAFSVKCVDFSADGKMLASAGSQSDGRLHVWNWRAGMLLASARVKCEIRRLCFSGDGQVLMSAGSQGHLKLWELHAPSASGKCRVLKGQKAIMEGGPDTAGRRGARWRRAHAAAGPRCRSAAGLTDRAACVRAWQANSPTLR
jgi:WD40 repeat protein